MTTSLSLSGLRTRTPAAPACAAFVAAVMSLHAQLPVQVRERDAQLAELAAEAAQRGPAAPIPLSGDTSRVVGVVYDQYLLGVVIGRAQIAAGQKPDARTISDHPLWQSRGTVVVAYPIDCEGRPNQPLAIRWTTRMSLPVSPAAIAGPVRGAAAQAILPGVSLPDDALVVSLRNAIMASGATVEVDYAGQVCRGAARTAMLPLQSAPSTTLARGVNGIRIPEQLAGVPSPSTVRISVTLDAAGRVRFPQQVQGPVELGTLAIADLTSRTFPPSTMNGVAMPMNILVPYVYTTTGDPAAAAPFTPVAPPGAMTTTSTTTVVAPATAGPPPPVTPAPPGLLDTQLARIAAEIATKGDPVPVPLDAAGPVVHGVVFDRFLVGAVKARAAFKAGTPIDPAMAPQTLVQNDLVAVAYPILCDGRTIAPADVAVSSGLGARPGPLRETGPHMTGDTLADRLPGVVLPAGAVGRAFAGANLSQNLEVRVTYQSAPCGAQTPALIFPIQWTRGQSVPRTSVARLPANSTLPSPTEVRLRGMVDLDGAYRFPTLAEGPSDLAVPASVTASQWRFQPYRANGVPSPLSVITTLTFTASGMPEAPRPGAPAPPGPPPPGRPPGVMTSSTVGGRSTTDFTTPDVPDLTVATSKCAVSEDATYGLTAANPIQIGGSFQAGPARARQYLAALRGPAGQGLRVVRLGSTMGVDKSTILDLYEITYAGLAAPIRLLVDQYHESPLKAPQGLSCATSIAR
jgi:hypothetical protein